MRNTLNRKYLMQAIDGSLERFGLDFVDVVYCHRADPDTTVEETVWAMSDIVTSGKALYWGTSEWSAERSDRRGDRRRRPAPPPQARSPSSPVQPAEARARSSRSTPTVRATSGTARRSGARWRRGCSPASTATASPPTLGARSPGYEWLAKQITDPAAVAKVENLRPIADELGCTLAQLALAWCTTNPNVSTVITGASRRARWSRTSRPST